MNFLMNYTYFVTGRIYSKFTATKLQALSETGIHNIITLFLTIALNSDLSEVVIIYFFVKLFIFFLYYIVGIIMYNPSVKYIYIGSTYTKFSITNTNS